MTMLNPFLKELTDFIHVISLILSTKSENDISFIISYNYSPL